MKQIISNLVIYVELLVVFYQKCYGKPDNQMLLKFGCETVRLPIHMDAITYLPEGFFNMKHSNV